ncbi:MAG TPA: HipA domain-containing protein, partial [Bacteroidales bacterium]|nr:HipA domain-containing protein [Bacteroidales bacterium]
GRGYVLSPAYDLVATALVNPADKEDLALTLNGKKKKINRNDFITAFRTMGLDPKQQENIFRKMINAKSAWMNFIGIGFLSDDFKERLIKIIRERFDRII